MLQKIRLSVCDMREPLANSGFFSRIYLCHLLVHGPGFLVKKNHMEIIATVILFQ